ncbi:MAG: SulP family inorganic anion transporter [Proteobacteria bacterium]|nr:SulP family inorganic anion transporter [Pseudomonadota bacterium]
MKQIFSNLRSDIPASIVVFLVAIPLCLGIALASGAPLISGLISGIIGGIVVGYLSGSSLGVSGPAAGLAVIVYSGIAQLQSFDVFILAVVVCGALQILFSFLRMGIIALYFPSSVIKGMLCAIGVIIVIKQIPYAAGYNDAENSAISYMEGYDLAAQIYHNFMQLNFGAIVICTISLLLLYVWETSLVKGNKLLKQVPAPLLVVILAIILGAIFKDIPALALSSAHLVNIPEANNYSEFLSFFTLPDFSAILNKDVYIIGATMAVVASIETLLSVEATDKMDPQRRITPTNRELFAQGWGNVLSGLIGGLPITQVIVRSSANIQSGAKTKLSAILHGFLILLSLLTIVKLLNQVPLAALAAILFFVGFKLIKSSNISQIYQQGKLQFIPFIVTIVSIVVSDLLVGIAIGMVVSIFFILYDNYKIPFIIQSGTKVCKNYKIMLSESVTFLNKASLIHFFKDVPDGSKIAIDASRSSFIDHDIFEIIEDFRISAPNRNIQFSVTGLKDEKEVSNSQSFMNVKVS